MSTPESPERLDIPQEILEAEQKAATPARRAPESTFGLPGLPQDIIDMIVKYAPWAALLGAVLNLFGLFNFFIRNSGNTSASTIQPFVYVIMTILTTIILFLSFLWLREQRRLGWYAVWALVGVQAVAELAAGGFTSLPGSFLSVMIAAYVLLQVEPYFAR